MPRIFIMIFTLFFLLTLIYGQQQEGMNARKNDLNNGMAFIKKENHHHHHHDICAQFVSGSDQQIECLRREQEEAQEVTRIPIPGEFDPKIEFQLIHINGSCPDRQLLSSGYETFLLFACNEGAGRTIGHLQLEQVFSYQSNLTFTNMTFQNLDAEGIQWNCENGCSTEKYLDAGECTSRLLMTFQFLVTGVNSFFHQLNRVIDSVNNEHSRSIPIKIECQQILLPPPLNLSSTSTFDCIGAGGTYSIRAQLQNNLDETLNICVTFICNITQQTGVAPMLGLCESSSAIYNIDANSFASIAIGGITANNRCYQFSFTISAIVTSNSSSSVILMESNSLSLSGGCSIGSRGVVGGGGVGSGGC